MRPLALIDPSHGNLIRQRSARVVPARVVPALTGVFCAVLVACTAAPTTTPAPPNDGSAFPVTITHKFGSTTIPAAPQRVVTIGDEDIAVALGVTPVGIVRNTNTDSGVTPWLQDRIDLTKTRLIDVPAGAEGEGAAGVNIEQVAALDPDLILAIGDFGLETDYPLLSEIAPTVGYETEWGGQSWQEQTMVGARALGLEERGRQVVAETEAAIRAARDANPGLIGRTVTFSYAYAVDGSAESVTSNDLLMSVVSGWESARSGGCLVKGSVWSVGSAVVFVSVRARRRCWALRMSTVCGREVFGGGCRSSVP